MMVLRCRGVDDLRFRDVETELVIFRGLPTPPS